MTYELILGDRLHSSWSLRGWLLMRLSGQKYKTRFVDFAQGSVSDQIAELAPARTVPVLLTPEGIPVGDSLALAEELASRHPESPVLPRDPKHRAVARVLLAEMHAGFGALRRECPMDLARAYRNREFPNEVKDDLERIENIWKWARETCETEGPWLCGNYCAADAFYAPIAARIAGFDLATDDASQAYVNAHLNHVDFRQWRALGLATDQPLERYNKAWPRRDWPRPTTGENAPCAHRVTLGTPENETCPYSGKPVRYLLEYDGRVFGFCNAICRDKTVLDPMAWPDFMNIYHS